MSTDSLGSASPHCKAPNLPSPVDEVAWLSGRHCTRCCLYRLLVQASDAGLGLPLSVGPFSSQIKKILGVMSIV